MPAFPTRAHSRALVAVIAVAALAGCSFSAPDLDGVTAVEERTVDAFNRIEVNGSGDVDITVGGGRSVTVTGDTALLEGVRASVSDGVLALDGPDGAWGWTDGAVHYAITVPDLAGLELSGSGDVMVDGLNSSAFGIELTGSGSVKVDGVTDELHIALDGAGLTDAAMLRARHATVDLSGSGDVTVNADTTLDVEISGAGDVTYLGSPQVSADTSGSGVVRAADRDES
ncbi:head GIN domain-containing protein [Demequina sp. NBRC 110053]|uniref:head GIN domain-containing protein n=1 Tax=Demequina sp. NBRC 110053 TaxID=1570342 RepID=UPI00135650C9|nr:head GIN domain-containing protein [Demequina sp. NBRC 110053]